MAEKKLSKKEQDLQAQLDERTADLQRLQADFENYRKRAEEEKTRARELGASLSVMKLLPVIDTVERAVAHLPEDLHDHPWAKGVSGLVKQLDSALAGLSVARIDANPGTPFDPELHEAIQFDEEATGETEVISEQLQAGYLQDGRVLRHAMVKVTRQ